MRKIAIAFFTLIAFSPSALAEQAIGSAAAIEKDVRGLTDGRSMRLAKGDAVYFNEALTTGADSRGRFSFADRTSLQMGPSSRVTLNSFVYSNGSGVGFNAVKGAFRFVSSPGAHKPYEVRTPTASVSVRGTIFGVRSTLSRTDAVLYAGVIEVCDAAGANCRTLDKPCTFVTVTQAGVTDPKSIGKNDWSFDKTCKGAPPPSNGDNPPPSGPLPTAPDGDDAPFPGGGPTFGIVMGTAVGNAYFADPVPLNGAAFAGGVRFGYNLPLMANIVVGFETDAQYRTSIGGSTNGDGAASGSRPGYLGTARVKLGYAFDRFLVYGAGGLAYGHIIAPTSFSGPHVLGPAYSFGRSVDNAFLPGWTVGAGISYALTRNVSVNAEYLYIKLQHHFPQYATSAWLTPVPICNTSGMHGIRFGVNYGFSLGDLISANAAR